MKLSPAAEFAIRGMVVLSERYGQGVPVTLETVCTQRSLPREYLTKIFASLARARLVTPIRGKGGGFSLSRPPSQISLLEVIEAVQGPIVLNFCQHNPPQCDQVNCLIRDLWSELQKLIREKLAGMSLAGCNGRNT